MKLICELNDKIVLGMDGCPYFGLVKGNSIIFHTITLSAEQM